MKKLFIGICFTFATMSITAQVNNFSDNKLKTVSLGLNIAYSEMLKDSPAAFILGVDYNWFHIDYSRHFTETKEEYSTRADSKIPWKQTNVGINIQLKDNVIITPKVGYMEIGYDDPELNFGLDIKFINNEGKSMGFGMGLKSVVMMNIGIPL